ncbi:MAG: nitroreductase family protein [Pseudomonadota bacterium]
MTQLQQLIRDRFGQENKSKREFDDSVLNSTLRSVLRRRSHRKYKANSVSVELINTLLATAFSAPSKSDLQQACVIVVDDKDRKTRIANSNPAVNWIANAPVFMVWCGDNRRIRKLCDARAHSFANDHLDSFMNAAVDAGIAMQTFIIAAESVGLGCCPVSQVRDSIDVLSETLDLPRHVFPVAGLCVGWPAQKGDISMRLPLDVTVHNNVYRDDNMLSLVAAYDEAREQSQPTADESQRHTDLYGVSNSYGWSEDHTRQYAQSMRSDFGQYIRNQGFCLD